MIARPSVLLTTTLRLHRQSEERIREAEPAHGNPDRALLHVWQHENLPLVARSLRHPQVTAKKKMNTAHLYTVHCDALILHMLRLDPCG